MAGTLLAPSSMTSAVFSTRVARAYARGLSRALARPWIVMVVALLFLMSAPLAMRGPLTIESPTVVRKSYPQFWKELAKSSFVVSEAG